MPPQTPPAALTKPNRPYFFYGHRKPTLNRPTVRGGLFSNRQSLIPKKLHHPNNAADDEAFDLQKWDPDEKTCQRPPYAKDPSERFFSLAKSLSPIARYIVDAFRKHGHWGPPLVEELNRLRRVTPKLVAEVLKFEDVDPRLPSKFFHWAGKQKGYRHDFACYNAFAYFLNRANHFRTADQLPELMHTQGKPPTEKQFEILIRMHSDANRGLRVHYVYEKMRKKFGLKPRVFLYNRIMEALVKTDHLDLAMSVYYDFKEDGLMEENVTFMILIKGLCRAGRMAEVFDLLNKMRKNLCKPDVFAFTAMVKVLVSEGNLDGCLRVWEEMRRDGVDPDAMAYSTLIIALCKSNRVEKGYEFFKEMKRRKCLIDRAIYGSLVEAYVAVGKVGSACGLLEDLTESGYRADLAIYNSLIEGLCNAKLVDRAYKLFHVTIQEDLQPDFRTVNPILLSYAESQRMEDFCKLLEQMQKLRFSVVDGLMKFFSSMLEKKDCAFLAFEVFDYLKTKNYISIPIYNILIEALLKNGQEKKALSLFHELTDSGLAPDESTHNNAILCNVKVGKVEEACACYNRIKEMSSVPSISAYYALVMCLSEIGEIDAAMLLIRDCLANVINGPLEFKYTLTIIHVCKMNDGGKVVEVVNEMVEQGHLPDRVIYAGVIYGMCKNGTIEEARKVFADMRDRKFLSEADVIMYDEMLIDHMKKKTADLMLSGLKFFGLESKLKKKGCTLIPS